MPDLYIAPERHAQCLPPGTHDKSRFRLFTPATRPPGSIWKCGECGRIWECVETLIGPQWRRAPEGVIDRPGVASGPAVNDVAELKAERNRLAEENAKAKRDISAVVDERDEFSDLLDKMSARIAEVTGVGIGEHSSMNDPWRNALEALDSLDQALELLDEGAKATGDGR